MSRPALLDTSFLVALERETARGELLEGAADAAVTASSLRRFSIQGLHLAHARRCALLQRRSPQRLGENDAWLVATAQTLDADIVGCDRAACERLGTRYLEFV